MRDVAAHPALAGAAHTLAEIFDVQHAHRAACLVPDPETGEPINASHLVPRSRADLERRRLCLERVAERAVGIMGRTPDYMNVTFAGFAGRSDEWGAFGNEAGAENLVRFQKELRRRDLSLTHTIIHPTIDKSQPDVAGGGGDVALHKVENTSRGILVRGARILATLAPFADEIAVYPGHPIPPVDGHRYALAFSIPVATPGLRFLCRDSVSRGTNRFDHPLSSRFDEQDAFVIFDDVEVPRERIFIDGNVDVYNQVLTTGWYPNVMQQTMIRAHTKLEFAYAPRLQDGGADRRQDARDDGAARRAGRLRRADARGAAHRRGRGVPLGQRSRFPNGEPLVQLRHFMPVWMPRVNEILRLIGSHNLLATPTESQIRDPELGPLIAKYLQGAAGASAEQRIRVFRLAWDFVGSALGAAASSTSASTWRRPRATACSPTCSRRRTAAASWSSASSKRRATSARGRGAACPASR